MMNIRKDEKERINDDSDPLCLFYYPRSEHKANTRESYRSSTKGFQESKTQKLAESPWTTRKSNWKYQRNIQQRLLSKSSSDEAVTPSQARKQLENTKCPHRGYERRTKERRVQRKPKPRRFGKEPVHNLTSYLLTSVKTPSVSTQDQLPSISHVLETITEAWQETNKFQDKAVIEEPPAKISGAAVMLERRRSVPEEIIRKFTVNHERTSESETNITMPEVTSPSSKESEAKEVISGAMKLKSKAFSNKIKEDSFWHRVKEEKSFSLVDDPNILRSAEEGSSDSDSDAPGMERFNTIKRAPFRRESVIDDTKMLEPKANQNDYYKNGMGILNMNAVEKSCQTNDYICYPHSNESRTTPSPWEESDSAESSETMFSSPRFCTRPLSTSDNLSSDSECINCTCAEIVSSKETSTDIYHSGKSTLSQTVSDKSTSTQDSTASINSISSRGSSTSVATESSTTDVDPRTSAKETTTSADNTPRTPKNDRRRDSSKDKNDRRRHSRHCPQHRPNNNKSTTNRNHNRQTRDENEQTDNMLLYNSHTELSARVYEWAQYSEEELKIIQQQRNERFIENDRKFSSLLSNVLTADNLKIAADVGSSYTENENDVGPPLMVPRYSALPRTMSMLVNSSSIEVGQLSDSDCQSLVDSLEDGQNRKEHCYYDTKQESKPVRGEVKPTAEKKRRTFKKEPRGRAYFFSVDDEGKAELVTNIHKIPELPKHIKNKIHKRHLSICKNSDPKENGRRQLESLKNSSDKTKKESKKNYQRRTNSKTNDKQKLTTIKDEKNSTKRRNELLPLPQTQIKEVKDIEKKDKKAENKKVDEKSVSEEVTENDSTRHKGITNISKEDKLEEESTSKNREPTVLPNELSKHRDELISCLETTATLLKNQQNNQRSVNKSQQSKRIGRFQQRFEVIPEERSSSLTSSAEDHRSEKNRRRSLPVKLVENAKTPSLINTETENKSFRRYTLGSIPSSLIAKLMGRPLQAIPCVQHGPNNQSQQIIIFSPKDSSEKNSSKGRDALLAMNREDFNRLSKGWMNFYLLKESSDSDNEEEEEVKVEENKNQQDGNTIVCHIPSMEKDPSTTSESCTDGTMTPPNINNTFSLMQQGSTANSFRLQEIPEKNNQEDNKNQKNSLCLIAEEPELINTNDKNKTLETIRENTNSPLEKTGSEILKTPKEIEKNAEKLMERKETKEVATCTDRIPKKKMNVPPLQLTAPIKLTSSNTVLNIHKGRSSPSNIPKSTSRTCSLPELNTERSKKSAPVKTKSLIETLPKVPGVFTDSEDSDSDSTVYMEAPSPRIPRLPLEDCYSSESSTLSDKNHLPAEPSREKQHIPLRRRPLPFRPKNRYSFHESTHGKKPGNSGWSVTVEGTLAFPRARPGVQMRLSFPGEAGPPTVSQSDSGFVEDRDTSRAKMQQKQQWTVTVKNPKTVDGIEKEKIKAVHLPNLSKRSEGDTRRGSKESNRDSMMKQQIEIGKRLSKLWPRVKEVIESEIKNIAEELILGEEEDRPLLSVEGRAVSFDTKPRFQTNSQRDVTRSNTARSDMLKGNIE